MNNSATPAVTSSAPAATTHAPTASSPTHETAPPQRRLVRPPTGWSSIVLVALMLLTVAWSIQAANPTPAIGILTPVVLGGVFVGALLGTQRWLPASLAHAWSLVIGLLVTVFATGLAIEEFPHAPVEAISPLSAIERMGVVRDWYLGWISLVRDRSLHVPSFLASMPYGPSDKNDLAFLFFAVTMALLMWLLSYICTWFIVRYVSWWGAVLPAGFALVFNLTNARNDGPYLLYLAFFLLCAFLLAAQTHLALQTERWRRERIGFSPDIGFELLRDGLIVAVAVIAFGWLVPPDINSQKLQAAVRRMTASTQRNVATRVNLWFPTLSYPSRGGGNAFGTEMGLMGSINLSETPIFDATVPPGSPVPHYWRQAVFDTYDSQGWKRSAEARADDPSTTLDLALDYALTVPVTQTIRTFQPETQQLYAAPQPERFDLPVRAEMASGQADILTVESQAPLGVDSTYQVVSRLTQADVESLRGAGDADPDWVSARYLQIPDSLPASVGLKASELTAGAATRYDKAAAIEAFLQTIPYSEQIDTPPQGRDRVEWFLFDEQRGYCDYYSSAFVMLARSAGVPARVAAGYATGEPVGPQGRTFRQKAYDAHTWPEVYFPSYGWVEFEPTANRDPVPRAATAAEAAAQLAAEPDRYGPDDLEREQRRPNPMSDEDPGAAAPETPASSPAAAAPAWQIPIWPILGTLAAIVGLASAGWLAWERPLRGLTPAESVFARLVRVARWLGLAPAPADTPHEYGRRIAGVIPDRREDISTIVDAYVRERFGRRGVDDAESARLGGAWQRLRDQLVRAAGRLSWDRLRRRR